MKKSIQIFVVLLVSLFALSVSSCREKTTGEKIEDGVEDVADDIEDGMDDVKDEIEDATDGN